MSAWTRRLTYPFLYFSSLLTKASISSLKPHGLWREMQAEADFLSINNQLHVQRYSQHDNLSLILERSLEDGEQWLGNDCFRAVDTSIAKRVNFDAPRLVGLGRVT